ncbi:branched-chain alpha-ketoacid dehydrogenase [Sporodiniella umbellata]|nr:branched-chain alpha-ketoacid dehydrogenase [Sporodiniella umbellata]
MYNMVVYIITEQAFYSLAAISYFNSFFFSALFAVKNRRFFLVQAMISSRPLTLLRSASRFTRRGYSNLATFEQPIPSHTGDHHQHFYMNKILDGYLNQSPTPLTLRQLMFYERHCNTERLLKSANYVRKELPVRIAHRIREFQKLPYILGTNPHIQCVYDLYWQAFDRIRQIPEINTWQDNEKLCQALLESLDAHQVVIPELAKGIHECEKTYQSVITDRLDRFMDATLRSRISRRVITEHHLVLSGKKPSIFNEVSSLNILSKCIRMVQDHTMKIGLVKQKLPKIVLDGRDTQFTYVSEHLEYILYQLLSNATRHTMSNGKDGIHITVCSNDTDILFRISDQGGGMSKDKFEHIWSYGNHKGMGKIEHLEAKLEEQEKVMRVQLGIGLPMSKVYAEYWGGKIDLVTMEGFGTDAYVKIPKLGTRNENLDNNNSPLDGAIM